MRLPGRIAAAIEILEQVLNSHLPISLALKNWGMNNRFAGSGDRAIIGNIVYDALRKKALYSHLMQQESARALALSVIVRDWGIGVEQLNEEFENNKFAPQKISPKEQKLLEAKIDEGKIKEEIIANFPLWLAPKLKDFFGNDFVAQGKAFALRPSLDLRVNQIKSNAQKVQKALKYFSPTSSNILKNCLRIRAGSGAERVPNITSNQAYQRGWFEIQDLGSQIVSALIDAKVGEQVLDYCAGAGGKTLAMAAQMQNSGQIFAYDNDIHRLKPIYERLRRNGVRNTQIISPNNNKQLDLLVGKMDKIVLDAPCSGSGTWRRRPETKWRLSEKKLNERKEQQAKILQQGAKYVRLKGRLIYITCSILADENYRQIRLFLKENPNFSPISPKILWQEKFGEIENISPYFDDFGLTLTPAACTTDGFYISILQRDR